MFFLFGCLRISSISEPTESDEEICCICMEKKTDIILGCTHNFCENCIREWNITSNTCPICRCQSNNKDCFILTERPNYFNLQDEMSKSLFEITDRTNSKATTHNNHSRARENASDSDWTHFFFSFLFSSFFKVVSHHPIYLWNVFILFNIHNINLLSDCI